MSYFHATISTSQPVTISSVDYTVLNNPDPNNSGNFLQLTDTGITSTDSVSFNAITVPQELVATDKNYYTTIEPKKGSLVAQVGIPYTDINNVVDENDKLNIGCYLQLTRTGLTPVNNTVYFNFTATGALDTYDNTHYFIVWDDTGNFHTPSDPSFMPLGIPSGCLTNLSSSSDHHQSRSNTFLGVNLVSFNNNNISSVIAITISGIYYLRCQLNGSSSYMLWINGDNVTDDNASNFAVSSMVSPGTTMSLPVDGYFYLNAGDWIAIIGIPRMVLSPGGSIPSPSYDALTNATILGFMVQAC